MPGRAVPDLPRPPTPAEPVPASPAPAAPPQPRRVLPARDAIAVGAQPGGLDKSTWAKFRTGRLPSMRTLDLHGRTAQHAYHVLHAFLIAAHADGVRCVEVITGRGSGEQGGVLRRELPLWLNQPGLRPLVLAASHPHAANPGYLSALEHGKRGAPSGGLVHQVCEMFGLIWDEAEDLTQLARLSHPRIVVDTAGLSPEQTALANRLAQTIKRLPPETVASLHALLDANTPQPKARLRRAAGRS